MALERRRWNSSITVAWSIETYQLLKSIFTQWTTWIAWDSDIWMFDIFAHRDWWKKKHWGLQQILLGNGGHCICVQKMLGFHNQNLSQIWLLLRSFTQFHISRWFANLLLIIDWLFDLCNCEVCCRIGWMHRNCSWATNVRLMWNVFFWFCFIKCWFDLIWKYLKFGIWFQHGRVILERSSLNMMKYDNVWCTIAQCYLGSFLN